MGQITKKTGQNGDIINAIISDINNVPELKDLPDKTKQIVAKAVIFDRYRDELRQKADIARINFEKEKSIYLTQSCRTSTSRVYGNCISRLESWCMINNTTPLELTPKTADDFIYSIKAESRSSASVRLDVAALSAFFTWLSRRHAEILNPFRGTKARPKNSPKKKTAIPSPAEMKTIIDSFTGKTKAAVIVMARIGLRVGALPSLTIRDGKFSCHTKGKEHKGIVPGDVLKVLKKYGSRPFADRSAGGIAECIRYRTEQLFKQGIIRDVYSAHDFRHFFAVQEYTKDRDIYRVKLLLGHASIQVTETYLKGLDVV